MWKIEADIHLLPEVKNGLHCADLHGAVTTQQIFVAILRIKYIKIGKTVEKRQKSFAPLRKVWLSVHRLHTTHDY
jgi:hypothetical protein